MNFISLRDGSDFTGTLPDEIRLPFWEEEPVPHERMVIYRSGEPGWDEALKRFMFLHGYVLAEEV